LVRQFHKLFRTVEFDLFGFLNLKLLNFKVDASTDFNISNLNRENPVMDNVEKPD
jgi:hypothetical protein